MEKQRVAVVGARGIGRHHANWWHLEGASVCAVAGTSAATLAETRTALEAAFGFDGRCYTDLGELLAAETPDIVDVCSPPPCHGDQVRQALEAGSHVLCEKPFVYDPALSTAELLGQARSLVGLAQERDRQLSVCAQYAAGARIFRDYWERRYKADPLTRYHGRLESPAKGRPAEPGRVWVDLAPHVISIFTVLFPGAQVQWDSLSLHFEGYSAGAAFEAVTHEGRTVEVGLQTANRTEAPANVRQFELNEVLFDVQGARDEAGVFHARIVTPDDTWAAPDMMRLLIRDFLAGMPTIRLTDLVDDLALLLAIRDRALAAGLL